VADIARSHLRSIFSLNNFMRQQRSFELGISFIDHWIEALIENHIYDAGKRLVRLIIDLLLDYVRIYHPLIGESSPILLPDGSSVTIGEVKNHYRTLLLKWYQKLGDLSDLHHSALASENLAWYAKKLLQDGPAKLVVMGHTHEGKSLVRPEGQYVNSGCWISDKESTYVEIDPAASPQAVVKGYPGNTPLAPAMLLASPASMRSAEQPAAGPSPLMTDEGAWEEEPLPQIWQQRSEPTE
jgi:hypothetical protein